MAKSIIVTAYTISVTGSSPKYHKLTTARAAPDASTRGYRTEMRALQSRQRPRSIIQLKTGNRSYHLIVCPHSGHFERDSERNLPFIGKRVITTLKKLPSKLPRTAEKTYIMIISGFGRNSLNDLYRLSLPRPLSEKR